ncbi:homoprotocatechuate degradation operon regulator HpaR [Serratia odorifera]|jgi:homoprotocatechuate degradation regulator HpaR|uniref:Homoprotocatechuate degradation operon regulator, HpaR n=2 Tax=Serratia odorifera TaxID=618 RepID=D4DXK9_SEROD|nr:homoprotocatechuate degradation operon regulator HpaR [Serratia odorifera]EFE97752.1 homoprotocatechuate degradation operon regulator, HpaR [Serratia odorifera DSM 4582]MBJ2065261.1 homoprotocatechuate degradation operon regulator HpaR [Serratia odorifera]PNK92156.1 homoprotocatechuate degradation operon regulator HpaR [Serratia odorifera]RII73500.1 homoprotocatechuate degradation operon regulator HpaR [Serratia odorifera]VDZ53058.1 Benzoate anaerobic degradation regulator [Serratia odorife
MHESLTIALLQARETAMGFFRPILKRHNLTEQQWRIIRVLADQRSIEFHELAAQTCILRPSLTGILSRMERDGLIFRLKPVNDQRKLYVSLTQQGQTLYDVARSQVEQGYNEIEAAFSPEKMQQLMALLDELITLGDSLPANVIAHPGKQQ